MRHRSARMRRYQARRDWELSRGPQYYIDTLPNKIKTLEVVMDDPAAAQKWCAENLNPNDTARVRWLQVDAKSIEELEKLQKGAME